MPVTIKIDGVEQELKPSLGAARIANAIRLNDSPGSPSGIASAFQRVSAIDIDVIVTIVAAGLGKKTAAEIKALSEQLYEVGYIALLEPVKQFITMLANGGRDDTPAEKGDGEPADPNA